MTADLFQKLAHHLDELPGGYPATESGVELRILRRLFTPEEAELALYVSFIGEEPRVIARRAKIKPEDATRRLEAMALVDDAHALTAQPHQTLPAPITADLLPRTRDPTAHRHGAAGGR